MAEKMTESVARSMLSGACQDAYKVAMEEAGKLLAKAAQDCGDDYIGLFESARSILNAFSMEMTFIRRG